MSDPFMDSLSAEQKRALIAKLMSELGDDTPDIQPPRAPVQSIPEPKKTVVTVNDDFTVNRENGVSGGTLKTPIKAQKNTWVDDELEHTDVKTPVVEKTKKRPPAQIVEVECSGCNKRFKVSSTVVYGEYHRCDRCAGTRR